MVEIMKSERSERYEAPLPPPNMSGMSGPGSGGNGNGPAPNGNSGMFHHHHHHHPFNNGAPTHHPNSLPRPMPPPIPSNGMNGNQGGNGGLHHHNSHHNSPLSRGNHHGGQGQVNGTGPTGPSPLVGSNSTTSNSAVNGVTVLNGQTPYESDPDNEKWWWVCCLEFCFCLL